MSTFLTVFLLFIGSIIVLIAFTIVRAMILQKNYRKKKEGSKKPSRYIIKKSDAEGDDVSVVKEGAWEIPSNENDLCIQYPREYRGVDNLAKALSFRTVAESEDQSHECWNVFTDMVQWMHTAFPLTFKTLEKEDTGDQHSLLLHWHSGHDDVEPMLLLAHMDVVPEGDAERWRHGPFSGIIEDDQGNVVEDSARKSCPRKCYVYGRGALDDKVNLISVLQAVENLLEAGFKPKRDVFLAFGCNEEVGGGSAEHPLGASAISATLAARGLRFACVVDEGGFIVTDLMTWIGKPIGAISVGEKSALSLRITCTRDGGHSSAARNPTAPGVIGEIAANIENSKGYIAMTKPVQEMFRRFGLEAPLSAKIPVLLLNSWLYKPLVLSVLMKTPPTAALVSTMHATCMLKGSDAHNVVPREASCVVNFRILHGETYDDVINWTRARVPAKYRDCVTIEPVLKTEGNIFSPFDDENPYWSAIYESGRSISEDAVFVPNYCMGGTDARYYCKLSDCVYRFAPQRITKDELALMHAYDERLSTENVVRSVLFFEDFIQRVNDQVGK